MHFNLDNTVTATVLAPASLDIKAETPLLVTAGLGIRCSCKQITDLIKNSGIGCRIGTWGTSDRGLVNVNYLVQLLNSCNIPVPTRNGSRTVQFSCQCLIQNLIYQRTLTGSGYARNTGKYAQWDLHINIL